MANGLQTQTSTTNTRDLGVRPPAGPCGFREGASPSAETLKDEAERPRARMGRDRTGGLRLSGNMLRDLPL